MGFYEKLEKLKKDLEEKKIESVIEVDQVKEDINKYFEDLKKGWKVIESNKFGSDLILVKPKIVEESKTLGSVYSKHTRTENVIYGDIILVCIKESLEDRDYIFKACAVDSLDSLLKYMRRESLM